MREEDIFRNLKLNLEGDNSQEKVPFITISNSKSNSSKNKNSKTSSNNKYSLTDNNSDSNSKNNLNNSSLNFEKRRIFQKRNELLKSSYNDSYSKSSLVKPVFDTSFYNHLDKNSQNVSLSEDKKEVKTESKLDRNAENETPKKKQNKFKGILSNNKTKNKAGKMGNFQGKDLMNYFKFMTVDVDNEEKNKNRVSSTENIPIKKIQLKKNVLIINKSWNKKEMKLEGHPIKIANKYNKSHSINKNQIKKIEIKKEKRSGSNIKISSSKRDKNNFALEKLLNKYINMPKNIDIINFPINKNNNYMKDINIINIEKKMNFVKIKTKPKSDSYKRKLSASLFLKKRDNVNKINLFNDYKPKQYEDINKNPIINPNKNINEQNQAKSNSIFDKILFNKGFLKIKPIKKELENKNNINIKKINNYNDTNSYFLKFKDNKELLKQDKLRVNNLFDYINKK